MGWGLHPMGGWVVLSLCLGIKSKGINILYYAIGFCVCYLGKPTQAESITPSLTTSSTSSRDASSASDSFSVTEAKEQSNVPVARPLLSVEANHGAPELKKDGVSDLSTPPAAIKTSRVTTTHVSEPILSGKRLGRVTAYWASEGDYFTGRLISATGVRLHGGHCAVDPNIIPYGSVVEVAGVGKFMAVDTGSAVVNRKAAREDAHTSEERKALVIDLFFESRKAGQAFAAAGPRYASISWWTPSSRSTFSPAPVIALTSMLRLALSLHPLRSPDEIATVSTLLRLGIPLHPLRSQIEVATQ
jgi:3D (Asp-Asp-Asp) domain-containing protein